VAKMAGEKSGKEAEKKEMQELIRESNISLRIEGYNDIFSSFDPRPFSQRALSTDFLAEAKRASRDKEEGTEIILFAPHSIRDFQAEKTIKKRLKQHFRRHEILFFKEYKSIIRRGISFVVSGIILMFFAALALFYSPEKSLLFNFLVILLEPAGWFLFWEGLDLVIFESKKKKPAFRFNQKLAMADVHFKSY